MEVLCKLKHHIIIRYFVVFIQGSLYCVLTPGLFLAEGSGRPVAELKLILPADLLAQTSDGLRYVNVLITIPGT